MLIPNFVIAAGAWIPDLVPKVSEGFCLSLALINLFMAIIFLTIGTELYVFLES